MPSNGNIFHVTGPVFGESTSHRWVPLTKTSDAELWNFLWSAPEQTFEQTTEMLVIWDAIMLIMKTLLCKKKVLHTTNQIGLTEQYLSR